MPEDPFTERDSIQEDVIKRDVSEGDDIEKWIERNGIEGSIEGNSIEGKV